MIRCLDQDATLGGRLAPLSEVPYMPCKTFQTGL
jgi:hypothetical protein